MFLLCILSLVLEFVELVSKMKGATCYKNDLENLRATELTLRPPGIDVEEVIRSASIATKCKKRALSEKKETDENEQATEPVAK